MNYPEGRVRRSGWESSESYLLNLRALSHYDRRHLQVKLTGALFPLFIFFPAHFPLTDIARYTLSK